MSINQVVSHLAVYLLQLVLILGIALPLPKLLCLKSPKLRLLFYYLLLAVVLVLPAAGFIPVAKPRIEMVSNLQIGAIIVDSTSGQSDSRLLPMILLALSVVALIHLVRLCGGLFVLRLIHRSSEPLDKLPPIVARLRQGFMENIDIRVSGRLESPAAFGWRRPVILLPKGFTGLKQEEQEAIVCHEMLHLKRYDWPLAILEHFVRSVLWFHPLVHVLMNRIHLAREQVIDREVVRITGRRRAYLETLKHAAETFRQASLAPSIPFVRARHLRDRVTLLTEEVCMSKSRQFVTCLALILSPILLSGAALAAFPPAGLPASGMSPAESAILSAAHQVNTQSEKEAQKQEEKKSGHIVLSEETDTRTRLIKRVNPVYPQEAKEQGITGKVVAKVQVNEEGKVVDVTIEDSPHELLSQSATEAIRQWEWEPATKDGKPVSFLVSVTVNFKLE